MSKKTILVVEDEEDILQLVTFNLVKAGYNVICAEDGEKALKLIKQQQPDLVILDLMLPGIDGLKVCGEIKENLSSIFLPVIILTAKGEDEDIISGFEAGADDYLPKPFSPRILLARIKALLRRGKNSMDKTEEISFPSLNLTMNSNNHDIYLNQNKLHLTSTEFKILLILCRRPGWVFSRQQIIDATRGYDYSLTDRSVDVQISGLRKKLSPISNCIETVRGVGYRFQQK
jgi:two-component system, OmpR family, alkaline phosphatase synthesis response regulator PhoP